MHKILWLHARGLDPIDEVMKRYFDMYQKDYPELRLVSVVLHRSDSMDSYMCVWGPR